jgi:hypothetical protein
VDDPENRIIHSVGTGTDLSSQAAARQVFSALLSLTSVFGMGTGGTSTLSAPIVSKRLCRRSNQHIVCLLRRNGDPCGNRTRVTGVRGRCLDRLTNGPCHWHIPGLLPAVHQFRLGAPSGTRTRGPLIKSQLLYQLS